MEMLSRFRGVMLGSAVGDALGAPIEFMSTDQILDKFPGGIASFATAYGRKGAITDDTQMTLFTAEGLILADFARRDKTDPNPIEAEYVRQAYLRWYETQTGAPQNYRENGWLLSIPDLHSRRAPGNTCLSALHAGATGSMSNPINDSKGCGGVMRVAPVALAYADRFDIDSMHSMLAEEAFVVAGECAASTHGNVSGYFSAAALAHIIVDLIDGKALETAVSGALDELSRWAGHEETFEWLRSALDFAASGPITPQGIDEWCDGSGGWVGEEALAIGVACALQSDDFATGVKLAANHSGDTDSTAQISGAILGAIHGVEAIPARALAELELADVIDQMAHDLYRHFASDGHSEVEGDERQRYFSSTPYRS